MTTQLPHPDLQVFVPEGSTMMQLIGAAKEAESAWQVFRAFMAEMTNPSVSRPPILFALDGLNHIMKMSKYRSQSFQLIHSHDLALVRYFCDALGGAVKFPHGGAVLAATSRGNSPIVPSVDLALAQRLAAQTNQEIPQADPFGRRYDERVEAVLQSVQVMKLEGINKAEARSLMEYWAASGVLRAAVDEKTVTGAWSMGGHGNVGEMERASLLSTTRL